MRSVQFFVDGRDNGVSRDVPVHKHAVNTEQDTLKLTSYSSVIIVNLSAKLKLYWESRGVC